MTINNALRLFLLIITNAGGEGKTFVTLLLNAIFQLLGEQELTLDTDPGNKASSSAGRSAKYLDPFMEANEAKPRIKSALGSRMSLLIDAGANMQVTSRAFEDVCREVGDDLQQDGYLVRALWLVSTNKLAAAGSAIRAARRIDPPFKPLFVFNDRDGSGAVPDEFVPDIVVEHLPPGLVALVNQARGFAPVVTNGIPDYQHSADMIANYLWRFVDQPALRALFGDDRLDKLQPVLKRKTLNLHPYTLKKPTVDARMEQLAERARILRLIDPCLDDVEAMIVKEANRFLELHEGQPDNFTRRLELLEAA